jgi:GMP synthase (glutamine-hydrolysing)
MDSEPMDKQKLLILKTGNLPRSVTEQLGPYERAFLNLLGDEQCVVVDARKESLQETETDWAGIIATGSPAGTYDGDAWIAQSEDFLRRAADQDVPIYGVCFGHQLVAQAFGGTVEKCPRGWELGTVTLNLTPEGQSDPLFSGAPASFLAQMSHGDVVTAMPPDAVALAQNEHWPYQAFRLGDRIWGTQFHPEFTATIVENLIQSLAEILPPDVFHTKPATAPLREWLLATVREAPVAQRCLDNFANFANSSWIGESSQR